MPYEISNRTAYMVSILSSTCTALNNAATVPSQGWALYKILCFILLRHRLDHFDFLDRNPSWAKELQPAWLRLM